MAETLRYFMTDHLGSRISSTDSKGFTQKYIEYSSYGESLLIENYTYEEILLSNTPTYRMRFNSSMNCENTGIIPQLGQVTEYVDTIIPSHKNKCARFDGSETLEYPDRNDVNLQAGTRKSLSFWMKSENLTGRHTIHEQGGGTNWWHIYTDGAKLYNNVGEGGSSKGTLVSVDDLNINTLYYIVVEIDTSINTLTMYINGKSQGTSMAGVGTNLDAHSGDWAVAYNENSKDHNNSTITPAGFIGTIAEYNYWAEKDSLLEQNFINNIYSSGINDYDKNILSNEREFFTGKQMDTSGLYYFNARYYDPVIGRFLSEDPSQQGDGWYNYCFNNPINKIDIDGKRTSEERKADRAQRQADRQNRRADRRESRADRKREKASNVSNENRRERLEKRADRIDERAQDSRDTAERREAGQTWGDDVSANAREYKLRSVYNELRDPNEDLEYNDWIDSLVELAKSDGYVPDINTDNIDIITEQIKRDIISNIYDTNQIDEIYNILNYSRRYSTRHGRGYVRRRIYASNFRFKPSNSSFIGEGESGQAEIGHINFIFQEDISMNIKGRSEFVFDLQGFIYSYVLNKYFEFTLPHIDN